MRGTDEGRNEGGAVRKGMGRGGEGRRGREEKACSNSLIMPVFFCFSLQQVNK